jgi:hypothetical protein
MRYSMRKDFSSNLFIEDSSKAKSIVNEAYVHLYDKICIYYEQKDFESLFVLIEQDGLPNIAVFKKDSPAAMSVLKAYFSMDNLAKTHEELKAKGHIYQFAKFQVLLSNQDK